MVMLMVMQTHVAGVRHLFLMLGRQCLSSDAALRFQAPPTAFLTLGRFSDAGLCRWRVSFNFHDMPGFGSQQIAAFLLFFVFFSRFCRGFTNFDRNACLANLPLAGSDPICFKGPLACLRLELPGKNSPRPPSRQGQLELAATDC